MDPTEFIAVPSADLGWAMAFLLGSIILLVIGLVTSIHAEQGWTVALGLFLLAAGAVALALSFFGPFTSIGDTWDRNATQEMEELGYRDVEIDGMEFIAEKRGELVYGELLDVDNKPDTYAVVILRGGSDD